jgi:flagellar M-ring protein FliF
MDANSAVNQFREVSKLPFARQFALLVGLAASVALGLGIVLWSQGEDYAPLYGDLSSADATEIIAYLDQSGVKYEFSRRTGLISVAADDVHQMRLKLASEGLPKGDGNGFEMLYKEQEIGVSSFMEKARYQRALEQELARTITSLESVKVARVHLAIPKQSAFIRRDGKPEASVVVNLYPGRDLTEQQLDGISNMVASSVPGLNVSDVSVIDQKGKLLSNQDKDGDLIYSQEQFRITRQLEENYVDRIVRILSPILGEKGVKAQVAADMDFTYTEKTSESYAPESKVRSEQLVEELSRIARKGGIPGTLSNTPPIEAVVNDTPVDGDVAATEQPSQSTKREVRNYELDRTISHVREAPGSVKRLSVAVVVNYREQLNAEGVLERLPIPQEELDRITALVKEAIGFNAERGDSVNVVNASFLAEEVMEPLPELSLLEQDWVWRAARYGLTGLAIFLIIFMVLRPALRATTAQSPAKANMAALALSPEGAETDVGEEQVSLSGQAQPGLQQMAQPVQQQLDMARTMVHQEPARVAHLVKNWVSADD